MYQTRSISYAYLGFIMNVYGLSMALQNVRIGFILNVVTSIMMCKLVMYSLGSDGDLYVTAFPIPIEDKFIDQCTLIKVITEYLF